MRTLRILFVAWVLTLLSVTSDLVAQTVNTPEPATIVVYGASGQVGSRIVTEALDRGYSVIGVGRTLSRITQRHERFTAIQGDVTDSSSVVEIIAGHDVVISAVGGVNPNSDDPALSIPWQATDALVDALHALSGDAPRMFVIGGARTTLDRAPGVPYFELDDAGRVTEIEGLSVTVSMIGHAMALDYLRSIDDIEWTFVAPPLELWPGERTGEFRVGPGVAMRDANGKNAVSMEDLAVAIINEIEEPQFIRKRMTAAYSSNGGVFPVTDVQNTPAQEVSWLELPDGRAIATVHGDRQVGEHISFVRFPPGLRTAVHTHSNAYSGIVVKGSARHYQPALEQQADWLMSGSFYSVPGNVPHISECNQESECIFAIHQHGTFDRAVVE